MVAWSKVKPGFGPNLFLQWNRKNTRQNKMNNSSHQSGIPLHCTHLLTINDFARTCGICQYNEV